MVQEKLSREVWVFGAGHPPSSRVLLLTSGGRYMTCLMATHPREHWSIDPLCWTNILNFCVLGGRED